MCISNLALVAHDEKQIEDIIYYGSQDARRAYSVTYNEMGVNKGNSLRH